jgi:dipeptidyl aminopeptidase/acylaminoacyl peptidase
MLAYFTGDETKRLIAVRSTVQSQPPIALNVGSQKLRGLRWADDTHLLIFVSTTTLPAGLSGQRHEFLTAQLFDLATRSLHPLLSRMGDDSNIQMMNVVAGEPQIRLVHGDTNVFVPGVYFPDRQSRIALFRVDLATGLTYLASAKGDTNAEDWTIDEGGDIVAETDYYEPGQRWELKVYPGHDTRTAVNVSAPIEGPENEGLSEDGTKLLIQLPRTEDSPSYELISLADGSAGTWQHSDLHLNDVLQDPRTGRVIGGPRSADTNDYVFFEPRADTVWRSVKAAFKTATNVQLVSWSEDWSKVVVLVFGPDNGDTYFFVDMTNHRADPIGPAYAGIQDIAPEKWIDYRAADGRDIHAYLTLPLNREAKNLPLVVLPHGGPHARDEPGFDWLSQALASRGYAVLQPEFRGSEGFGRDLLSAGFGEFGKKMQTDLSDGVRALAAQGLIDSKRVCIVGASYGGYAALAGATLDTGVYRCAISIAGLSDLRAQLSYWHWPHSMLDDRSERFWDRFLGVSDLDDPRLDAISPIKHIDKVSIPILLIHGRDDTVVPFSQSEDMADALEKAGKQVEFVKLDGEDHWLSRSATRLQMLQATVKFLEANNPPG